LARVYLFPLSRDNNESSLLYVRRGQETADEQVALINTVEAAWCHCRRVRRCCYFLQRGIWVSVLTTHTASLHLQMFLSQSLENELKMETRMTNCPSASCFPRHLNLQHNVMSWRVHYTLACEFRILGLLWPLLFVVFLSFFEEFLGYVLCKASASHEVPSLYGSVNVFKFFLCFADRATWYNSG